jgi:flavin reductase (DIM6/NTAB) family NADH-FMN oxidoreductase RutF
MQFDCSKIDPATVYRLITATVVPRPIAWVVTLSRDAKRNAAPFSYFNVMSDDPPTLVIGINGHSIKGYKDTARNILDTKEFVVNLVPFSLVEAMNATSIDAPQGTDELVLAGLETRPSQLIAPPRIAKSPVAFECVLHTKVDLNAHDIIVVGRIVSIYVEDRFLKNPERGHVDTDALDMVGRTFGTGYVRTADRFSLSRPSWPPAT